MQYDESGYPVKVSQPTYAPTAPTAALSQPPASATAPHTLPAATGPVYDENGSPLKQQHQSHAQTIQPHSDQQREMSVLNRDMTTPSSGSIHRGEFARPLSVPAAPVAAYQTCEGKTATHGKWSTGFCDVLSDGNVCMDGFCCYPCQAGRLHDAVNQGREDSMNVFACCVTLCFANVPIYTLLNRRMLVDKYSIDSEGCCSSVCLSYCCPQLSACQMHRELQARGVYPGGFCAPVAAPESVRKEGTFAQF